MQHKIYSHGRAYLYVLICRDHPLALIRVFRIPARRRGQPIVSWPCQLSRRRRAHRRLQCENVADGADPHARARARTHAPPPDHPATAASDESVFEMVLPRPTPRRMDEISELSPFDSSPFQPVGHPQICICQLQPHPLDPIRIGFTGACALIKPWAWTDDSPEHCPLTLSSSPTASLTCASDLSVCALLGLLRPHSSRSSVGHRSHP